MIERDEFETNLVPGPVPFSVLLPEGYERTTEPLPLLLYLHGGGGDHRFLDGTAPLFERSWKLGTLPPLVAVTPSAGRSFYLDYRDGSQRWETFLLTELLPRLRERYRVRDDREGTLVAGVSMGGLGALRLAFRHPERFRAVAALEPGMESAERFSDVPMRDRPYRPMPVLEERYGSPFDADFWEAQHPLAMARRNGVSIAAAGLAIYVEAGDRDRFQLDFGAESLHRVLREQAISHEYRLVAGADHVGDSLGPRLLDALAFLGRALGHAPDVPAVDQGVTLEQFHRAVEAEERAHGFRREETVEAGDATIHVRVVGDGEPVVLLPSLGRGADDFRDLADRLAREGYQAILPEPRGIGKSRGPLADLTLHDVAADAAAVVRAVAKEPVTAVGHAYGNRVARALATDHPALVSQVALLAAGGKAKPRPGAMAALLRCFDERLSREERLAAIAEGFFASGRDPSVWEHGWHVDTARAQSAANLATPVEDWWAAGGKPLLVVQGLEDPIAPPENARLLADAYGERVTVRELPRASHAMLPEQPAAVATAVLGWLRRKER